MSPVAASRACRRFRRLAAGGSTLVLEPTESGHVERCAACKAWLERLSAVHRELGNPVGAAVPSADFALRVRSQLPASPLAPIGETARRWMPLAAATLVLLAWANWASIPSATPNDPLDDLLVWSLELVDPQGGR